MIGSPRSPKHRRPLPRVTRGSSSVSSVSRSSREGVAPIAPRLAIAGIFGVVLIGILVLRLWALTVIGGAEYVERADSNVIRKMPVVAPRGSILDRTGRRQIVVNRQMNQVVIDLQDIDEDQLDDVIVRLGRVLAPNPASIAKTTADIRAKVENAPPGAVEPVVVAKDVPNLEVVMYLAEHQSEFPGVDVPEAYTRDYLFNETAAHLLGQVKTVSEDDLKNHPTLQPIDRIGASGLELEYDQFLRGTNGYDAIQVDAAGVRSDSGLRGLPPTPGSNLVTTIDLKMQRAAEQATKDSVARVSRTSEGRDAKAAAAVAIDPRNGEVLTMLSYPSYNPNVFVRPSPENERIVNTLNSPNNKRTPLLNRALQGEYPAGSTFKPLTAIAALQEGYVKPDQLIGCPPSKEIMHTVFLNNTTTNLGAIDLGTALEVSCNTYFYYLSTFFYGDPGAPLQDWAKKFGLGSRTGIDIPGENAGLVPTVEWRKEAFKDQPKIEQIWKPGYTVNMSIGQGDLRVTPLQMANAYATLANGGTWHTPHIAKSIQNSGGREIVKIPPGETRDLNLDPAAIAAVKAGMERVNSGGNGTASAVFSSFKIKSAGKTGTAERTGHSDTAWYCGYAPADNPTIAACAVVDGGGHGGTAAAPIVLRMFQEWFGEKGGNLAGGGSTD